jgi:hypothetical protein
VATGSVMNSSSVSRLPEAEHREGYPVWPERRRAEGVPVETALGQDDAADGDHEQHRDTLQHQDHRGRDLDVQVGQRHDPATLLTSLAAAYCRAGLGSAELIADVAGHGVSALGRAAPRLASATRASAVPFVFMLDDLHEVHSPAGHDVLGVVISAIPPGSQLAAASRDGRRAGRPACTSPP